MTFDISKHRLVPKHIKLSDSEKAKLLEKYSIGTISLPKIIINDVAVAKLAVKEGDVIKIERDSKTVGKSIYYRVVING